MLPPRPGSASRRSARSSPQAGATFADVLKVTVYLTDINDRPLINPVRQEFFGASGRASTLVEVSALAIPGAKVEIEAVARASGSVAA